VGARCGGRRTLPAEPLCLRDRPCRELFGVFFAGLTACSCGSWVLSRRGPRPRRSQTEVGSRSALRIFFTPTHVFSGVSRPAFSSGPVSEKRGRSKGLPGGDRWLTDVDGLDRAELGQHLFFARAVAGSSLRGIFAWLVATDRASRSRWCGPELLLGLCLRLCFLIADSSRADPALAPTVIICCWTVGGSGPAALPCSSLC